MPLRNTPTGYGSVTRLLHWAVFLLFAYQFLGANLMTRLAGEDRVLGMGQDLLYNWHKSIGLVLLLLAFARVVWRRSTPLPDWSDALVPGERVLVHRLESMLYFLMFALPITGYLFVTAGGYGVKLFGVYDLPAPFGRMEWLATLARGLHVALAYAAVVVIAWHLGMVLRKQLVDRAPYLQRMLPFGRRGPGR
jgi:cytochrome b561